MGKPRSLWTLSVLVLPIPALSLRHGTPIRRLGNSRQHTRSQHWVRSGRWNYSRQVSHIRHLPLAMAHHRHEPIVDPARGDHVDTQADLAELGSLLARGRTLSSTETRRVQFLMRRTAASTSQRVGSNMLGRQASKPTIEINLGGGDPVASCGCRGGGSMENTTGVSGSAFVATHSSGGRTGGGNNSSVFGGGGGGCQGFSLTTEQGLALQQLPASLHTDNGNGSGSLNGGGAALQELTEFVDTSLSDEGHFTDVRFRPHPRRLSIRSLLQPSSSSSSSSSPSSSPRTRGGGSGTGGSTTSYHVGPGEVEEEEEEEDLDNYSPRSPPSSSSSSSSSSFSSSSSSPRRLPVGSRSSRSSSSGGGLSVGFGAMFESATSTSSSSSSYRGGGRGRRGMATAGSVGGARRRRRWRKRTPSPQLGMGQALPRSTHFVVWSEFCERFSFYGMKGILGLFMVQRLGFSERAATEALALFVVACYATPLLGAYLSDACIGRYRTIVHLSGVHLGGNIALAVSAIGATTSSLPAVAISLSLVALGTGGIKPCVAAFGGDQIDPPEPVALQRFFSRFYFSINAGSFLSSIFTPMFRLWFGYAVAFALPALLMGVALVALVGGRRLYRHVPPHGDLFSESLGVCWVGLCAWAKGDLPWRNCLDAGTQRYGSDLVGDVRQLSRILVVLAPAPVFWSLFDQQASRWTFQAARMDCTLWTGGPTIQPEQMQACNAILVLLLIPLFDKVLYPLVAKTCGQKVSTHAVHRMAAGMLLAALSFLLAAVVQSQIDKNDDNGKESGDTSSSSSSSSAGTNSSFVSSTANINNDVLNGTLWSPHTEGRTHDAWTADADYDKDKSTTQRVNVLWQVPQYVLITAGEILFSVTGLEFAFKEAPDSMKSVVQSGWLLTSAVGNLITVVVLESLTRDMTQLEEFLLFALGCVGAMGAFLSIAHGYCGCSGGGVGMSRGGGGSGGDGDNGSVKGGSVAAGSSGGPCRLLSLCDGNGSGGIGRKKGRRGGLVVSKLYRKPLQSSNDYRGCGAGDIVGHYDDDEEDDDEELGRKHSLSPRSSGSENDRRTSAADNDHDKFGPSDAKKEDGGGGDDDDGEVADEDEEELQQASGGSGWSAIRQGRYVLKEGNDDDNDDGDDDGDNLFDAVTGPPLILDDHDDDDDDHCGGGGGGGIQTGDYRASSLFSLLTTTAKPSPSSSSRVIPFAQKTSQQASAKVGCTRRSNFVVVEAITANPLVVEKDVSGERNNRYQGSFDGGGNFELNSAKMVQDDVYGNLSVHIDVDKGNKYERDEDEEEDGDEDDQFEDCEDEDEIDRHDDGEIGVGFSSSNQPKFSHMVLPAQRRLPPSSTAQPYLVVNVI